MNQTLNNTLILSLNCSCLIPFLDCCFRSSVKKTAPAMRTGSQEAERRFLGFGWLTHTQHVVAGPREAKGSSPAGQVTQSSQGLTITIWPHLPCSLPLQVSMASTWRPTISDITSTSHKHTDIHIYKIDAHTTCSQIHAQLHCTYTYYAHIIHTFCTNLCTYEHIKMQV